MRAKNPELFLQLTNYLITEYSTSLYREVLGLVPDIRVVNDLKFLEACYLVMRDILQCYPVITVDQFLTPKFLDLKLQFITELSKNVYEWDARERTKKVVKKAKEVTLVKHQQEDPDDQ